MLGDLILVVSLIAGFLGVLGVIYQNSKINALETKLSILEGFKQEVMRLGNNQNSIVAKLGQIDSSISELSKKPAYIQSDFSKELEEGLAKINKKVEEQFNDEYLATLEDKGV